MATSENLSSFSGMDGINPANLVYVAQESDSLQASSAAIANLQASIAASVEKLLDSNWSGDFSEAEIQALLDRMPYLQISAYNSDLETAAELCFVRASTGWLIHDGWDAMSVSPGEHLFNTDMIDDDDEGGSGRSGIGMPPGVGTIVKQCVDTATQMVKIAKKRGWKAIYIQGGHRLMQWATWLAASNADLDVYNFSPSEKEHDKVRRLYRNEEAIDRILMSKSPGSSKK